MKYIDTKTQQSLKQGIMEFLGLSSGEMMQMFMSIYKGTAKNDRLAAGRTLQAFSNKVHFLKI